MDSNIEVLLDTGKRTKDRNKIVLAKCHCGIEFETNLSSLRRCRVRSCGCSRVKNIVGETFGLLKVISKTNDRSEYNGSVIWNCECRCGNKLELSTAALNHPDRVSCGCFKDNIIAAQKAKAGKNHHWYNHNLKDEDRVFRKSDEQYTFAKNVFIRDNFTCKVCCKIGGDLEAHHLNGYHWYIIGRNDVSNGVTLCKQCHKDFHSKYSLKLNTKEQFIQYMESKNV